MKIAIVEDEVPAREQLISLLQKVRNDVEVVFTAQSIQESVAQLKQHSGLDLIFMDIQLNDGLSLEVFDQVSVTTPVIFATAFDQYTLQAFQQNGIDYLLKPIKQRDLEKALFKFDQLQRHFQKDFQQLLRSFKGEESTFKKRVLVRKGGSYASVPVEDIRYFFSEHKVTFLVNQEGQKLIVDENLSELEHALDSGRFFRLSRAVLSSLEAIDKFTSDGKGKLQVDLIPPTKTQVTVSQERTGAFKQWVNQ